MAEAAKRNMIERIGGWFRSIPEFIVQVKAEARKIVWPTRKETTTTAIMVVIMTLTLGLFFFGVDNFFNAIVHWLLKLTGQG